MAKQEGLSRKPKWKKREKEKEDEVEKEKGWRGNLWGYGRMV